MFSKKYCRKHSLQYSGYVCPQCAEDMKGKEFEREKKKRDRKKLWDSIIWK